MLRTIKYINVYTNWYEVLILNSNKRNNFQIKSKLTKSCRITLVNVMGIKDLLKCLEGATTQVINRNILNWFKKY